MSKNRSLDFLVGTLVVIDWMNTKRGVKCIRDIYKVGCVVGRTHLDLWNMNDKSETIPFAGFDMGIVQIRYLAGQVVFHNPYAEKAYANGTLSNQEKDELAAQGEWKV